MLSVRVSIFGSNRTCSIWRSGTFSLPRHSQDENHECLVFDSMLKSPTLVKPLHLCFVLESRSTYDDPLSDDFSDSDVQRRLEKMFSVESLGIREQEEFSNYDEQMVELSQQSISVKDKYYVQLPWNSILCHFQPF